MRLVPKFKRLYDRILQLMTGFQKLDDNHICTGSTAKLPIS